MIVNIGAIGQLGRLVIQELLKSMSPADIVATVRSPEKAADLGALDMMVRHADYIQPASLSALSKTPPGRYSSRPAKSVSACRSGPWRSAGQCQGRPLRVRSAGRPRRWHRVWQRRWQGKKDSSARDSVLTQRGFFLLRRAGTPVAVDPGRFEPDALVERQRRRAAGVHLQIRA